MEHNKQNLQRHNERGQILQRQKQRGLTLIELMVVIVILGVLSAFVMVNVLPAGDRARVQAARTQISAFDQALQQYKLDLGNYPNTDQGLEALLVAPNSVRRIERYREGGYLAKPKLPLDPWDSPYEYQFPGEFGAFDIYSLGRDGKPGGTGLDADIGSWQ